MAFNIWRITDGKAGHDSQSTGLCNAIKKLNNAQQFDIPVSSSYSNYKNFFFNRFPPGIEAPDPDLIIGAGHQTHLPMLTAKRVRGGKTIVLMKPSLPLSFFDICIIPEHDDVENRNNLIETKGAINPVIFNEHKSNDAGLILLGGPSRHYRWDNDAILEQIKLIISNSPGIKWTVADSPRTPKTTSETIAKLLDVTVLSYPETGSETLRENIYSAGNIWISKDSVSMIYESLTSGAAVGILDVEQIINNKITDSINKLIKEKQLTSFEMWKSVNKLTPASFKFNEADRCASILSDKGFIG